MHQDKKLARTEWEIMSAVWRLGTPVTVRQVHDFLHPGGEKAYTTTQTIMNILVNKRFLKRRKIGMVNFYTAVMTREQAAQRETRTLISRLFQGSVGALANYLVDSGELTPEELQQLKDLIESKERDAGAGGG